MFNKHTHTHIERERDRQTDRGTCAAIVIDLRNGHGDQSSNPE